MCICAIPFRTQLRRYVVAVIQTAKGKKTIADRVVQFGDLVHARLAARFNRIGLAYPPAKLMLVGLKFERTMQVWVCGGDAEWKHLL